MKSKNNGILEMIYHNQLDDDDKAFIEIFIGLSDDQKREFFARLIDFKYSEDILEDMLLIYKELPES